MQSDAAALEPLDEMTVALIDRAVTGFLHGEGSLEHLISVALFGRPPGANDDRWPVHAQRVWNEAVRLYDQRRTRMDGPSPQQKTGERKALTVQDAWAAVFDAAPCKETWWRVPNLSWVEIGLRFAIGERSAEYRFVQVQGWQFVGRGENRRVQRAPCYNCEETFDAQSLHEGGRCETCARNALEAA